MRNIAILVCVLFSGCATYTEKMEKGLDFYKEGRMETARESFESIITGNGDVHLMRLEKGMAEIALGDGPAAIRDFTAAIERMDSLVAKGNAADKAVSIVLDDTARDYPGSPFEQISARLFLAMAYLMTQDNFDDVSAVCRDMDTKMERIEAYYKRSYEFDGKGNESDFSFQIPPVAKYFAAIAAEQRGELDNADIYMRHAVKGFPGCGFFKKERKRMERGGRGSRVFVFALLGMVPRKIESESAELTGILKGAKALFAAAKPDRNPDALGRALFTAPVRIPAYPDRRPFRLGGFRIEGGGLETTTEIVADFDRYARKEYEILLPGILIRAAVRRAVKEGAGQVIGKSVSDDKKTSKFLGDLFASAVSVVETVDTRSWCALPRELHAASLVLKSERKEEKKTGQQPRPLSIVLTPVARGGGRMGQEIAVTLDLSNNDPAFVIIIHPGAGARPIVVIDKGHRIDMQPAGARTTRLERRNKNRNAYFPNPVQTTHPISSLCERKVS